MNHARKRATVYIIDDEESVRRALERLMRSVGIPACAYGSVEEFMDANFFAENACVLCDIRMPGHSGLKLPDLLKKKEIHIPVIFVTAHDTPEARSEAKRVGAAGFFCKPVDPQALLDAIDR